MKLSSACSSLSSKQHDMLFRYFDRIFVTYSIPHGNNITLAGKIARRQTGSVILIGTGNYKEALLTDLCEEWVTYSVSKPHSTPNTAIPL